MIFFNIDIEKTIKFINEETFYKDNSTFNKKTGRRISAIIPVHVWGNAVWLDELVLICKERNIKIIEDAAESLGTAYLSGEYKGKYTGSIGEIGCLSFNGNKIITTGGGGMILTSDPIIAERAKYLTTQAKDDSFHYIHNEIGYNYRLTNIQAALGLAQLEQLNSILEKKKIIYEEYSSKLFNLEAVSLCKTPGYAKSNHWLNIIRINNSVDKQSIEELTQIFINSGIQVRPIWRLNHLQKPYSKCQSYLIENTLKLVSRSLCIPSSFNLSMNELNQVIDCLTIKL